MIIKCDSIWISNKVLYRIWNSAKVCFYPLFRFEINHVNCIIICKPFTFFDTWSTPTWFVYMLEPCYLVKFFFFLTWKENSYCEQLCNMLYTCISTHDRSDIIVRGYFTKDDSRVPRATQWWLTYIIQYKSVTSLEYQTKYYIECQNQIK